jgi:hypothetical protein
MAPRIVNINVIALSALEPALEADGRRALTYRRYEHPSPNPAIKTLYRPPEAHPPLQLYSHGPLCAIVILACADCCVTTPAIVIDWNCY